MGVSTVSPGWMVKVATVTPAALVMTTSAGWRIVDSTMMRRFFALMCRSPPRLLSCSLMPKSVLMLLNVMVFTLRPPDGEL